MSAYSVRPGLALFLGNLTKDTHFIPGFLGDVSQADGVLKGWVEFAQASTDGTLNSSPQDKVVQMPPTMLFSASDRPPADLNLPTLLNQQGSNTGYEFGEVLLAATWQIGFSPRLYYRTDSASESSPPPPSLLAFVAFSAPAIASSPVSLDVLTNSASVGQFSSGGNAGGRGRALRKVIEDINENYQVLVRADASLLDQPVFFRFTDYVSLPYVLDAIALYLNAVWDWNEDAAVIRPRRGRGGCDDRLANR